jgi:hypothetical protein
LSHLNVLWRSQVTVVVVSLITVALWCVNTALRDVVGDQGIVAIFPLVVFFGTGILTKDDFNSFLWNIVMLAQVHAPLPSLLLLVHHQSSAPSWCLELSRGNDFQRGFLYRPITHNARFFHPLVLRLHRKLE